MQRTKYLLVVVLVELFEFFQLPIVPVVLPLQKRTREAWFDMSSLHGRVHHVVCDWRRMMWVGPWCGVRIVLRNVDKTSRSTG